MFVLAVMHQFRVAFSPWWLLVPGVAVCAIAWMALKFRRKMPAILAGVCLAIALLMGVMLPLSWNGQWGTAILGNKQIMAPVAPLNLRRMRYSVVDVWAMHGRIQISFGATDYYAPLHFSDWPRDGKLGWRADAITDSPSYGFFGDGYGLIKSDFIQKTLGFQLCWWNGPHPDGSTQHIKLCSVTLPQWFVLAINLIPPALWLRKRIREKWLRRSGFPVGEATADARTPPT